MRMNDVRKIAKEKCINTYAMKKKDIIGYGHKPGQ